MDIGCSTIGLSMLSLDAALDLIAGVGFSSVEIGMWSDGCPHLDLAAPPQAVADVAGAALTGRGLRATALNSAPWVYCEHPWDEAELLRNSERLLALAQALGCSLVVNVHERPGSPEDAVSRESSFVREVYRRGRDYYGVAVCVEAPHRGHVIATMAETVRLLDSANEDGLGLAYDTSHATSGGHSVADGLQLVGSRIHRVQLRDHRGDDFHYTPGDGEYDWAELARFLRGRDLPLCIEVEFDGHLLPPADIAAEAGRGRSFVKDLLER